jgi:acyl-CoA synthetase (AMP-forming)/AMP-acid ligase II
VDRRNLAVAFEAHVLTDPTATALVVGDDRWSRAEITELASRVAGLLVELGARPGDAVVSHYHTEAADIAVALAAARLGCTFVPIPIRLGPLEFGYVLQLVDPVLLVLRDVALAEQLELPTRTAVRSSDEVAGGAPITVPIADEPPGHVPVIGFTSGSTGRPKGVMHGWAQMSWVRQFLTGLVNLRPGESICVAGAGGGVPGFTFYTYFGLASGAPIVQTEKWDPRQVLRLMGRENCVWSTMVPTMMHMLLEARQADPELPLPTSMRGVSMGGAFMATDLIRRARVELGLEVLRVYAMAECMMACQMRLSDPELDRDELDGRPGPGAEVAVFDDARRQVPPGTVGELGLKGPSLFEGYLGDPDGKQVRMTPEGFFLSGDMGRLTPGGFIKVVGRKKDLIIRGGFNIDPVEIEELIRSLEGVRDVAVIGYPDERFGERACAVLVVQHGVDYGVQDLARHLLAAGLSKEKLPERVVCTTDVPRSPDGKVLKAKLRDQILSRS